MKDYNKVESCLKSFLKNNKRLSYSMALLISFLINGGFSYADEAIQVPLRTEIKTRIEKEQENISQMLKEADESMKDIELKIKKLTQRGEFWVKPLEKSYQGLSLLIGEIIAKIRTRLKVTLMDLNIQLLMEVVWDMDNFLMGNIMENME